MSDDDARRRSLERLAREWIEHEGWRIWWDSVRDTLFVGGILEEWSAYWGVVREVEDFREAKRTKEEA